MLRSREKEAPAKQAFPFPAAIPAKSKVRSTSGMKRLDFGGEGELRVSGVQDKENVHLYPTYFGCRAVPFSASLHAHECCRTT